MTSLRGATSVVTIFLFLLAGQICRGQEAFAPSASSSKSNDSFFDAWGAQLGYITGNLRAGNGDDLQMLVFLSRFKHPINGLFGLEDHKGKFSLVMEPFVGQVYTPDNGMALGVGGFFEYAYPLNDVMSVHTGFGSGPSYFGIDTIEEGKAGFQFFDSASAGATFKRGAHDAFLIEFRAVHISDLSLREPNNGINAYSFWLGYNSKF
jgi:hypothetical protein